MKILIFSVALLLASFPETRAQGYTKINREMLQELTLRDSDTCYVVHFWATWCAPCITEIEIFEELHRGKGAQKLSVILVSLDFPKRADESLLPFLKKKQISAPVFLVTDTDYNSWIDMVDPVWTGAVPASLIYSSRKRIFHEGTMNTEELYKYVTQILN